MTRKLVLLAIVVLALAGLGSGLAVASSGGGSGTDSDDGADVAITGVALVKASDAALAHTRASRLAGHEHLRACDCPPSAGLADRA